LCQLLLPSYFPDSVAKDKEHFLAFLFFI
jgi:hypothetical protein